MLVKDCKNLKKKLNLWIQKLHFIHKQTIGLRKLTIYLNVEIVNNDVKHEKDVKKHWWKHFPKDMKGRKWSTYVNEQSCNDVWRIMCDLINSTKCLFDMCLESYHTLM
jgi:hypothetical protein